MADLLFENDAGEFEVIYVDATLQEIHTSSVDVTDHPVAQGADVTDNIKIRPSRLQLQVFISNDPIRSPDANGVEGSYQNIELEGGTRTMDRGAAVSNDPDEAEFSDGTRTVGMSVLRFDAPFDRVALVWDQLDLLKEAGTRFLVATSMRSYADMVIKEMSTPKTAKSGGGAVFTLEMREIFTVTTGSVDLPDPFDPRAQANQPQGAQEPETESPEAVPESILVRTIEGSGLADAGAFQPSRIGGR